MGRGPRSPKRNDAQVMIRDVNPQGSSTAERRCWNFPIIGPSEIRVLVGTAISGLIIGSRVAISSRGKALGFAPNHVAAELIQAVRTSGKRLQGQVLSDGNSISAPIVELCLR